MISQRIFELGIKDKQNADRYGKAISPLALS